MAAPSSIWGTSGASHLKRLHLDFSGVLQHPGCSLKCPPPPSQLREIAPIDLVIGGSPCQDFSIANPGRRGLIGLLGSYSAECFPEMSQHLYSYGFGCCLAGEDGILFFEYYRILMELKSANGERPLFWLFENVASMNEDIRRTISRFFSVSFISNISWISFQCEFCCTVLPHYNAALHTVDHDITRSLAASHYNSWLQTWMKSPEIKPHML